MFFRQPAWMNPPQQPSEQKRPQSIDIPHDRLTSICNGAGKTNAELQAEAITRADGFSFQIANPWLKRTDANTKLINHWLESKGITYPQYADFSEAVETLAKSGLLSVDEADYAAHLDGNDVKKFRGTFTKREFTDLESLIAQEREAVLKTPVVDQSDIFEGHDIEEVQARLRQAEQDAKALVNNQESTLNADAWVSMSPTYRDDVSNGKLLREQLILNGVTGVVTVEDYERANRQLVAAGLVRQNPAALRKQQAQDVVARAQHAVKNSAAFDTTTFDEAYELPLDEVRRRANGNFTGRD